VFRLARIGFTVPLQTAADLVNTASGILPTGPADLVGAIGRAALSIPSQPRDSRRCEGMDIICRSSSRPVAVTKSSSVSWVQDIIASPERWAEHLLHAGVCGGKATRFDGLLRVGCHQVFFLARSVGSTRPQGEDLSAYTASPAHRAPRTRQGEQAPGVCTTRPAAAAFFTW